jgi:ABC-type Na+ efflux pump permease subunit
VGPTAGFGWNKVAAVAAREYVATVRTKAFLVALVMMPLLTVSALLLPLFATQLNAGTAKPCAVLDETGAVFASLQTRLEEEKADERSRLTDGFSPELGSDTVADLTLVDAGSKLDDTVRADLSERVRQGELFAFVEIPGQLLDPEGKAAIVYSSNTPTSRGSRRWLIQAIETRVHELRLERMGIDPGPIRRAQTRVPVEEGALYERSGSAIVSAAPPNPIHDVALPIGAVFLLFMSLMLGASPLMQSTLEEKMQRIAEVIVSSVPPLPLMLGKLTGAALVSYTILGMYLGGALLVAARAGVLSLVSLGDLAVLAGFQAIAFVMYGSVFLAVGSACNDLKETQSLMMPAIMLITTPLLVLQVVMDEPNGTAATWLSLFPFFTPPLMILRYFVSPGAPAWQVALGAGSSLAAACLCLIASSRVFRIGLLMQGNAPTYRQLWRWIRHG